jgi:hypothetical protein
MDKVVRGAFVTFTILIPATALALVGILLPWLVLVVLLGVSVAGFSGLGWLTKKSQSKFARDYRGRREERRGATKAELAATRAELQKATERLGKTEVAANLYLSQTQS